MQLTSCLSLCHAHGWESISRPSEPIALGSDLAAATSHEQKCLGAPFLHLTLQTMQVLKMSRRAYVALGTVQQMVVMER